MSFLKLLLMVSVVAVLFVLPAGAQAQSVIQIDVFFDQETNFRLDRFIENPIQIRESDEYELLESGKYYVTFVQSNGSTLDDTKYYFTPESSAFQLTLPYVPQASSVHFFQSGRNTFLSQISIQEFSRCDLNGVCSYEDGESIQICPQDCNLDIVTFSSETEALLNQNDGQILSEEGEVLISRTPIQSDETHATSTQGLTNRQNNRTIGIVIAVISGVIAAVLGGVIYKLYKK